MKTIYTLRGNNYKDDIAYDFDGETITAKYITNGKVDAESTTQEDTFDLSVLEEGDRFEGIKTDLPIDVIVDAERKKDGELYVKLAWMPLKVTDRLEKFGDNSYRVNVEEYIEPEQSDINVSQDETGEIIKTDAKVVQEEEEIKQLKSEISSLEREMKELEKDMAAADLWEDKAEKDVIRQERDSVQQELQEKYNELDELEG